LLPRAHGRARETQWLLRHCRCHAEGCPPHDHHSKTEPLHALPPVRRGLCLGRGDASIRPPGTQYGISTSPTQLLCHYEGSEVAQGRTGQEGEERSCEQMAGGYAPTLRTCL